MSKMKELYEKVAGDSALQAKFAEIMKEAAKAGEETKEKLINFAKEAGFEVTREEMEEFFKKLGEKPARELSDMELDAVAGGKGVDEVILSVASLGTACLVASIMAETENISCSEKMKNMLKEVDNQSPY